MRLFDIFKKQTKPYKPDSTNLIYELLFCDNLDLYKDNTAESESYPWNILFSPTASPAELKKIVNDENAESRVKILAYNLLPEGEKPANKKELLAVIVEIGLDNGLDVLGTFKDGSVRYINQTGSIIVWETPDEISTNLVNNLFDNSLKIVGKIGVWDKPRRPHPTKGVLRITFLVSDGIYFGEGPINVLFSDPMAGPALSSATELMKYVMSKAYNN